MAKYRTSLSLALIAAYFIALPVISEYAGLAHVGQFTYRIADHSPVLLLFCIVSLTGAVLFAGTVRQMAGDSSPAARHPLGHHTRCPQSAC